MQLKMFSVHDKAVKAFMPPFTCRSTGEAVRSFMEACNDEKHNFFRHASDYVLYYVGDFDDNAGRCVVLPDPERVLSALECLSSDGAVARRVNGASEEVIEAR